MAKYTFTERLYLTSDGKVVKDGHPEAARLLGVPGRRIALDKAQALGLTSDSDLTAGSVDDVLKRVGDDIETAAAVLELESAKPNPRKTLIEGLESILNLEEES